MTPQNHGLNLFYYGLKDEQIQTRRQFLLSTNKSQLQRVAQEQILAAMVGGKSSKVVFGTQPERDLSQEGWRMEDFSKGLKLRAKFYKDTTSDDVHVTM